VAGYVAGNLERLAGHTRRWNRTWYDSTLPYWFLDRTFVTVDCLATQTLHRFDNGRWWGWEGVDCCPGTCQHVWQYAQSVRRDCSRRWNATGASVWISASPGAPAAPSTTAAKAAGMWPTTAFCGTLVRVYREHQMSPDAAFLQRIWPRVRKSPSSSS
jgi:non-lysosomal glucosylceramidase